MLVRVSAPATAAGASRRTRARPRRSRRLRSTRSRSSTSSRSTSGSSAPSAAQQLAQHALVAAQRQRRVARRCSAASSSAVASSSPVGTTSLTSPQCSAVRASMLRAVKNSSRVRGDADRVEELAQAGVRVHEPELGRRHPELDVLGGDAQVARRARARGRRRSRGRSARRRVGNGKASSASMRRVERVGDELLGLLGELARAAGCRCRSRRRTSGPVPVSTSSAAVEPRQRRRDRVEDLVVERVALGRVGDREPRDVRRAGVVRGAACPRRASAASGTTRARRACRPR